MDYPQEVQDKLDQLRTYVPFVERMIAKLELRSQQTGTSHGQLERLYGLHRFLTKPIPRAPRMEMLEKMEAVIRSMHEKVQKAQGKPVAGSSPRLESNRLGPESSHAGSEQRLSGHEQSHSGPESSRSGPETGHSLSGTSYAGKGTSHSVHGASSKSNAGPGHSFSYAHGRIGSGGEGQNSPGHGSSAVQTHRPSLIGKPGSSSREFRGREGGKMQELGQNERTKERATEISREASSERNRGRDFGRSEARHMERSRESRGEKSREREYERSRSKDFERKRDHDFNRPKESERNAERDGRNRTLNEKDYERNRERGTSSREREREREKNREFVRGSSSQEKHFERNRERDFSRMDRQHNQSEYERRQNDGKLSSKRNSLLDLPMPPSSTSQNMPHPFGDMANTGHPNLEKFQSSREKLQRLFGIHGDSSKSSEGEASTSATSRSRGWRDEVRARGDQFFNQRNSGQVAIENLDGKRDHHQRHKSQQLDDKPSRVSQHSNIGREYSHIQNSDPKEQSHHWKSSSEHSGSSQHIPLQQNLQSREDQGTPRDTPLSPDQSPNCGFSSVDTPQSPDIDASFSPTISSEENTPVKTIPLENLQQKGVDLEAIKKALAQIRANERPLASTSNSGKGPSYRYEDFVGPPKSQADEDEPYDPEEVWNNQDKELKESQHLVTEIAPLSTSGHRDVDLRQIPKSMISLPQSYQGKIQENQSHHSGHQGSLKNDATRGLDSGNTSLGPISNIPLPERQSTVGQGFDKPTNHISLSQSGSSSTHSVTSGAGWFHGTSTPRSIDSHSSDVDMRLQQHQHHPPVSMAHQPPLQSSHQPPLPKSDPLPLPNVLQPPLPKSHQPSVTKLQSQQPSLPQSHQSTSFQPPLPKSPPPETHLPQSPIAQIHPTNKRSDELQDKDGPKHSGRRLDNIRSRIALKAGELIKPGQQGVAASQMERYKLKRQTSGVPEVKSPTHSSSITNVKENLSTKSESNVMGKESVSVLDILLPENKANNEIEEGSIAVRDPRQVNQNISTQLPRDPRLKHQEQPPENEATSGISRSRDPRLSSSLSGAGLSNFRDPRHQANRDPRQESSNFSSSMIRDGRDDSGKFYGVSGSSSRDPRQDPGKYPVAAVPQARDPRHDTATYVGVSGAAVRDPRHDSSNFSSRGSRDPRQEIGGFTTMGGSPYRDPRVASRGERPSSGVWQSQQVPVIAGGNPAQSPSSPIGAVDPHPSQSTSSSLIGQTFTCLMMRGLPPFTNSNHIYSFFQEYILRDMCIELDSRYQCKGTAYVHFPSHASAREALESMNGHILRGYPVTLRICTVGILRQAKNAYEQLNRDREAQLGIPERPRGNGNPFFKPRPKEQPSQALPSKSVSTTSQTTVEKPILSDNKEREAEEVGDVSGNTTQYSELCGVKVPPKSSSGILSFKIPKIKKDATVQKASRNDENKNKAEVSARKSAVSETLLKSNKDAKAFGKVISESDDDLSDIKTANKKHRKFKKIVIHSDSESEDEAKKFPPYENKVESVSTTSDRDDDDDDDEDEDEDDDDDDGYMIIDETAASDIDETEESEVSSQVSEEPLDQLLPVKVKEIKKQQKKKGKGNAGKQKTKKRATGSAKVKKKVQAKTEISIRKVRGKRNVDKPELNLHPSVGLKLTRHTQGELEELISEKKKLKVIIPVPHKLVVTLFDEDKLKKRGGRQKPAEATASVSKTQKVSESLASLSVDTILPITEVIAVQKPVKVPNQDLGLISESKKNNQKQTKESESEEELFLPVNTRLHSALKREVAIGTPTSRKGKKRKISTVPHTIQMKRAKTDIYSNNSIKLDNVLEDTGISGDCHSKNSRKTAKRGLTTPTKGSDNKKSCLEVEGSFRGRDEDSHQLDLFESDVSSDDMPDITQITPSLLDVDPTISNALPNATALASVLSPPHISHQMSDSIIQSKDDSGDDWSPGKLQIVEEKFPSDDTADSKVREIDKELDEMIDIVIESGEGKCETEVVAIDSAKAPCKRESVNDNHIVKPGEEYGDHAKAQMIPKPSYGNFEEGVGRTSYETIPGKDKKASLEETTEKISMTAISEKSKKIEFEENTDTVELVTKKSNYIKKGKQEESIGITGSRKNLSARGESLDLHKSFDIETNRNEGSSSSEDKSFNLDIPSLEKGSETKDEEKGVLINVTESQKDKLENVPFLSSTIKNVGLKADMNIETETVQSFKTDGELGDTTFTSEDIDDGDDTASVGKVSTSSFVDDASVVSSESRELKTPESQASKRGKRGKSLAPVECRRVTRGSIVEPLTAEIVEWDDGGLVDLYQCDLCDYVGRHMANHLVNFHTDRELPCEFKKEDFPPVIKDHVGPPKEQSKDECISLDLSWIPTNMNFEKSITCKDCDYISNSRFDLIYHYLEHNPKAASSVYHCRLCNFMSERKDDFYNHVSSHTGEYRYRCELCGHRTYKMALLQAHHKECHTQPEKFFISSIIEEDGWLYIHVCKICMFVRISLEAAEEHVQHRHGGKRDIHKANMSRHIVLHSDLRKFSGESESIPIPRPKYKGKKKKKGKKGPSLEVFVGEEVDEKEVEEKAKQLVDRIASNIHTTMSVQEAQKRMSLLNSISKKLDEDAEEEKQEADSSVEGSNQKGLLLSSSTQFSTVKNKNNFEDETINEKEKKKLDKKEEKKQEESKVNEQKAVKDKLDDNVSDVTDDVVGNLANEVNGSGESDSESTMSAVDPPEVLDDEMLAAGKGFLQDTIRKLSAKLEEDAKKTKLIVAAKEQLEAMKKKDHKETSADVQCISSSNAHDEDSDSDNLVICEDVDSDCREAISREDSEAGGSSKDKNTDAEGLYGPSLQDSIQSILREASSQNQQPPKMPKLRIRPAHQLLEPRHSYKQSKKQSKATLFKCCVPDCYYVSVNNMDLIQHIIVTHGPYKCIASGCQFVTTSRDLFSMHLRTLHPKMSFLVCPFHCNNVFRNFGELIDHLSQHHMPTEQDDQAAQPDEDSEVPGFLRIESVSTLDPTAASQMFGDDFDGPSSESVSSSAPVKSPQKLTVSNEQGVASTAVNSLVKISNSFISATVTPNVNDSMANISIPGTASSRTSTPSVSVTSSVSLRPFTGSLQSGQANVILGNVNTSSEVVDVSCQPPPDSVSSSSQVSEVNKTHPSVVTLDEDEEEGSSMNCSRNERPPPPGMTTLPKIPPTVPVQSIFEAYQPTDIFKTLITKLAPEVFKCMFKGCVFADDDREVFLDHILQHGKDYRCCYCLMVMSTPAALVEHIVTEHSHCQFQCKYCLYRAFTKIYMGVHLKNFHPYEEPRYIKVGTIQSNPPANPPIDQFVRPYRCNYQECQYRTVDAEAFKTHVNTHGQFVILSCDFCHKHLHVIPLIDHMREHQMNEYQCPYCLHGDAEKERLLSHLLNCHSGRPGKVLLRKQITSSASGVVSNITDFSPPPPPDGGSKPERRLCGKSEIKSSDKKTEEGIGSSDLPVYGKEVNQALSCTEGRRISRSLSRELDSKFQDGKKAGDEDVSSIYQTQSTGGDDSSSSQTAEKTDLSGHALYRCGNEGCEYSSISQIHLKEHLQVCDLALDSTILRCYHCGKQCRHLSTLLDHLRVHGPKRYYCGVSGCDYRATMVHYFKNHMKQIHRCSGFKQLLKDLKNRDPETQEFVVYPKDAVPPFREGHRKRKNEYGIEDLHRIPRSHVSYHDLKCYYCSFTSKVRLNLIKHISLHDKHPEGIPERLHITSGTPSPIPVKQPINPVPCLERKELMFDKMMNLAGSSFECRKKKEDTDLRSKNPIPLEEYQKLPKFVPEERLYSCGIQGCNYLSCDDMMLKYHIRTLHADITSFPCPHCTDLSITVEKMSSHFKLHGERLYRCGWCSYISYRRNMVERHMKEKHPTKKSFDFIIRENDDRENQKKVDEQPLEEPPIPVPPSVLQDPQWQCGLCKFSSVTQQEIVNHTSLKHAIKSQYKCGYCSVRSSVRTSFDAHFAAKHPAQPFRVLCMYYRLDSEDIEPLHQGSTPHCHEPLWKRSDPERIRHIRGILLEDDPETKKNWLKQTGTGKPDKGEFVCPRCGSFKTSCLATFRSHLCREADYDRYQCVECGVSNALLPSLQRHYTKVHHKPFTSECYLNLPVEDEKEAWVEDVISHQQQLIKQWQEKGGVEAALEAVPFPSVASQQSSPSRTALGSRRSSTNSLPNSSPSESSPQQGGVVLHDSGSERGRFVCDTCGSECRSAAGLKSHTTAMHQARYKCHYCPFASNSEDAVKQHSSVKHPKLQNEVLDVSQRCKVQKVDESLSSNIALGETDQKENKLFIGEDDSDTVYVKEVIQGKTLIKEAQGSELSGKGIHLGELKKEVKFEVGENIHEEGTISTEELQEVVKMHSCPFCPYTTSTSSGLNHHKRSKHANTRLFMCLHCNGRFNTNQDALRHHKWKHQQLKPNITHLCEKAGEDLTETGEVSNSELSEGSLTSVSVSSRLPKLSPVPKPVRAKARKSFTKPSTSFSVSGLLTDKPLSEISDSSTANPSPVASSDPEIIYSCCHCNQRSSKIAMEVHMKKQHRDLPYQVRREEGDKIFTEVHIYRCIHCIAESISLAQAMDHWIQNHPLLEFKFRLVVRHCGEVSNQVVSSTTADKELPQNRLEVEKIDPSELDADVSTTDSGISTLTSTAVASSTVVTSSSESSSNKSLPVSKRRGSGKDMKSPRRYSIDTEEEDPPVEASNITDEGESVVQSSSEAGGEDMIYKCGLCKKSSEKLEDLKKHMNKIHPDRQVKVKKLRREIFEQLYRAEYECGYCGERARHHPINRHHKSAHPNQPIKITRLPQPPRENIYFRCDVCGHVVKNLQSIRQHIRRHHPEANEFTFSKLTLGSPARPPIKQPFKCNYCGDVGETIQEMHTHHAFLHSHLECSITNLMDEALSSVHSPSTSHNSGETKNAALVTAPTACKSSMPAVVKSNTSPSGESSNQKSTGGVSDVPVPRLKNTARKSISAPVKRSVAVKSTSKPQPTAQSIACDNDDESFSFYRVPQSPMQLENVYAFVNLGAGVPMRLTVQQLGRLFNLWPQVTVTNAKSTMKISST